jgi:hypothetical protein
MIRFPSNMIESPLGFTDPNTESYIRATVMDCASNSGAQGRGPVMRRCHYESVINAIRSDTNKVIPIGRIVMKYYLLSGDISVPLSDMPNVSPGGDGTWAITDVQDTTDEIIRVMTAKGYNPAGLCLVPPDGF